MKAGRPILDKQEHVKVAEKWGIDLSEYDKWVNPQKVVYAWDRYMEKRGLKSNRQLGSELGIHVQTISGVRTKARRNQRIMAVSAIVYMDSMGIDPRLVLDKKEQIVNTAKISAMTALFLETFPNEFVRASMIKHKEEILALILKETKEFQDENTPKLKEALLS